jgi:hypothetical protein
MFCLGVYVTMAVRSFSRGVHCRLGGMIRVTDPENMQVVPISEESQTVEQKERENSGPSRTHDSDTQAFERLIRRFSRPASQVTGSIVSLLGLMLVAATFFLGVFHAIVTVDFGTAIIAGAALSIAGIWTLKTEDDETRRAAERELMRLHADDVSQSIDRYFGTSGK